MSASFAYVYDERLSERKFQRAIARFEADLAGFGIGGRIGRLTLFRKAKDTAEDFARDGIRHLVIVGDDETLLRMMWFLPDLPVVIGFMPLLGTSKIASLLGIRSRQGAVAALAGRLTATFDAGKVGDRYFLTKVVIPDTHAELEVDGKFRLRPTEGGTITVSNLGDGSPSDGVLDVSVMATQPKRAFGWLRSSSAAQTRLPLVVGHMRSDQPVTLEVDGQSLQGSSFRICVAQKKLRFLVGKGRR